MLVTLWDPAEAITAHCHAWAKKGHKHMQHKSRTAQKVSVKVAFCLSFIKMFVQNSILTALHLFTVQLLKQGHLEEDYLMKNVF